jgi:hypothetical protein
LPASQILPEWYKKTDSYIGNKKVVFGTGQTPQTIKKCIPVFDMLSAGYIITTHCDIWIKRDQDGQTRYISSHAPHIEFHDVSQAPYHPAINGMPFPKFINPWSISTPKGYSCLVLPPAHGSNRFFTIFGGFVDTDNYSVAINFPFVLNDINFQGLIPAGTPVAQIIPIKREKWKMKFGTEKNYLKQRQHNLKIDSYFFDKYKNSFWVKKEFK